MLLKGQVAIVTGGEPSLRSLRRRGLAEYYQADSEKLFKQMCQGILQGRPQTADEIAAAALFLVSDHASAITGQTLNVDGGMAFY
jgi:NAD(P)-dependent dehydrogenase (short-subunit alcohol dehydrogenase family)